MADKGEMTQQQVADALGCSVMQVYRFAREGKLSQRRDEGNRRVWYDAGEVEALAAVWTRKRFRRRPPAKIIEHNVRGKIAAKVFRAFQQARMNRLTDADEMLRWVVIETEADPVLVRQLWREWDLGVRKAEQLEAQRREEEAERQRQRDFDKQKREETYREWRLQLARTEARGKVAGK